MSTDARPRILCVDDDAQLLKSLRWLLARDLDTVSLGELHEGLALRVPGPIHGLPGYDDRIGRDAGRALANLQEPLAAPLARSVGSFFTRDPDNSPS